VTLRFAAQPASHGRPARSWLHSFKAGFRRPGPDDQVGLIGLIIFCILFPEITGFLQSFIIGFSRSLWGAGTLTAQFAVLSALFLTWMLVRSVLRPDPDRGQLTFQSPADPLRMTAVAILGAIACVALSVVIFASVRIIFGADAAAVRFNVGMQQRSSARDLLIVIISLGLLVPLIEELIFRKWLFERMSGTGLAGAYPVTSIAFFGFVHIGQSALKVATIMLLGALCTWLYLRTRDVRWPWLAHATNNTVAIGMIWLGI
jgi:membrane protease YdiL (CAAX protease family)